MIVRRGRRAGTHQPQSPDAQAHDQRAAASAEQQVFGAPLERWKRSLEMRVTIG
jgi:hypothetical protein